MRYKIYISGAITGKEHYIKQFNEWAENIRFRGHEPVNPVNIGKHLGNKADWKDYMIEDLKALLDCDAVLCLPGWQLSRGAKIEINLAIELGLMVFEADELYTRTEVILRNEDAY